MAARAQDLFVWAGFDYLAITAPGRHQGGSWTAQEFSNY